MSVIETVARAMAENAGFKWEHCAQSQWESNARAGIEAMRDMAPVVRENGEMVHELRGSPDAIWKMMIDAVIGIGQCTRPEKIRCLNT